MKTMIFENDKQRALVEYPDDLLGIWTFHLTAEGPKGELVPCLITVRGVEIDPGADIRRIRLDFLTAPLGFHGSQIQTGVENMIKAVFNKEQVLH